MKKFVCLSLILCMCAATAYAQADYKYALKVYSVHSLRRYNPSINNSAFYYDLSPSFGFQWQGKQRQWQGKQRQWHEVQFRRGIMSVGKSAQSFLGLNGQSIWTEGRNTYKLINMSYEYNWNIFKTPHKLMPSLGGGTEVQFSQGKYKDFQSDSRTNSWGVSTSIYFVPRLAYNLTPRLFLDANAQLNLMYLRLDGAKNVNTYNKTNIGVLNTEFNFLQYNNVKVGLGYRF